jgi:hypothetical protein
LALAAALTLLATLGMTASASAFTKFASFDGTHTPAGSMVPERMAVDPSTGNVYVIDSPDNVVDIFNRYGKYLSQLDGSKTPGKTFMFDGLLDTVAVDNSSAATKGNVYVVGGDLTGSTQTSVITAYKSDGTFLWQVTPPFPVGSAEVGGVAVDPTNGNLWVGNRSIGVEQLNPANGALLGNVADPSGDAPGPIAFDSVGNLYAAPWQEGVSKLTPPITSSTPTPVDPFATWALATDTTNNDLYIDHNDGTGYHIAVYNSAGVQDPHSPFGTTSSQFNGVAVNGAADRIYVSNLDTNAVEIWARNPPPTDALTVSVAGQGTGKVDADQGAIAGCGSTGGVCTDNYEQGNTVTLTATAKTGVFAGWSGPDAGACAGTTSAAKSITATFDAGPPVVTTGKSASITQTAATLNGTVNPDGGNVTDCHVEYGTSTSYGAKAACSQSVGGGGAPVNVSAATSGLTAGTTYHYRVVATNSFGTTDGSDATFATLAAPTCATDASLCQPPPTCANTPSLCPPPPTCQNTPSLCPPPPPTCANTPSLCPPPPAVVSVHGASLRMRSGKVTVSLGCGAARCGGTVVLRLTIKTRHGHKTVTRTITAASATVSIAAGKTVTVVFRLSGAAKAALAKSRSLQGTLTAGGLRLNARVTVRR